MHRMSARALTLFFVCAGTVLSQSFPFNVGPPKHERDLPAPGLKKLPNGNWSITVEKLVGQGDHSLVEKPSCNADANSAIKTILDAEATAALASGSPWAFVAPLVDTAGSAVDAKLKKDPGFVGSVLSPNRSAACAIIGALTPTHSIIDNVVYRAGDGDLGESICTKHANGLWICPQGYCQFDNIQYLPNGKGVAAVFKNWGDRAEWASITVEFQSPTGVTPKYIH